MKFKRSEDIEFYRGKLNSMIESEGMDAPDILQASRELDEQIVCYVQNLRQKTEKEKLRCMVCN